MNKQLEFKTLVCEQKGPIFTIILNRPERLNAFDRDLLDDLAQAIEMASQGEDIRVVVISGAGRVFSCGGDLQNLSENKGSVKADAIKEGIQYVQGLFDRVEAIKNPTIAAINGHAVGAGFQLSLACDFRIAVQEAKLGVNDLKIGILPALGATTRLPKLIGLARAKELVMTGDLITAGESLEIGLINRVVEKEALNKAVLELADTLMGCAPLALIAAKDLLNSQGSLEVAASMQARLFHSADATEGIKAFLEKRSPRFRGV